MREELEQDLFGQKLFLAGELVPAGRYKELDSPHVIELEQQDVLPASLNGRVTCYTLVQKWSAIQPSGSVTE